MGTWIYWLIIAIFLIIIEAATTSIICIWFIVSSILALFLSLFIDNIIIQIGIFVLTGILLLILTKPIINKYIKNVDVKTNLDRVIGMSGIVTEKITKHQIGEVKVDGKCWSAVSTQNLKVGETVKILKIDGVKIVVERKDDE